MCSDTLSSEKEGRPVRRKFRALKWISAVIVVILLLVFFGVPAFLSSSAGTGFVVNKVNNSVDGEIGMGDLNVGWFKGVRLKEFSFADDKGLTNVNVREITAKPSYSSMLSGNISLGKVVVDGPEVSIRLEDKTSSASKPYKKGSDSNNAKNAVVLLNQIDLTVKDGDVKIFSADGDASNTIHFSNIASKVDLKPAGEKSSFDVGLDVENKGRKSNISASGNVTSKKGWTFKGVEGDVTVKVDDLDLATLSPVFALLGKNIDVEGELNIDAEAKFGAGQVEKLVVDAKLDKFKHVATGKVIALSEPVTLNGRVSSKNDKVNIEDINLKSSFCTITGKGTGSELDYTATMDVGKTMDFVGTFVDLGGYSFAGSGDEKGRIIFKDDTIAISGETRFDNFVMGKKGKKSTPVTSGKFTFNITADTKKENVKIDLLTMKTTDTLADIRINDSVFSWAEDAKEKVDMKINANVDLAGIMPFATFFEAAPAKMEVAGRAVSEMLIKSSGNELKLYTDNTKVTDFKLKTEGVEKTFEDKLLDVKLDMTADFEDKTVSLNSFLIDGTQIDVKGNFNKSQGKNDQTKLSGEVTAKYDLADMSTIASAYLPEGIEVEGKREDVYTFQSQYPNGDKDKLMANMNATGKFGFERAKYMGMKIGKVEVAVDVKNGLLNIAPFSTSVNNGTLNFAGSADLTKQPVVFKTPKPMLVIDKVQVDDEMGKALLKYLNPLFAEQTDLSGVANLYCDKLVLPLGGDTLVADAQIDGTVAIGDMRMKNQGLLGMIMSKGLSRETMNADLQASKIVMDKGFIRYDDMQVNIDSIYPINFKGAINLNNKPGTFEGMFAALPYKLSIKDGGVRSVKIGEDGKNRVSLPVKGTIDKPWIDWREALKNVGGNILQEILKKNGGGDKDTEKLIEDIFKLF